MTFTTCKCDCKWNMLPEEEEAKNSCKLPRLELLYGICFHIYIYITATIIFQTAMVDSIQVL